MIMVRIVICFCLLFFLLGIRVGAQSIDELRQRKAKTADEIRYTNQLLEQTNKSARISLNKLSYITKKIRLRNRLITDINSEMSVLNKLVAENEMVIDMLSSDLEQIRKEYETMIIQAQKNKSAYNKLLFLLSAENFNQAYKRLIYLRQYAGLRKRQVEQVEAVKDVLAKKVETLGKQKRQKQHLLSNKKEEKRNLAGEQKQQSRELSKLEKEKKRLRHLLNRKRKVEQQLQEEIERLIAEEARKAREQGKKGLSASEQQLSADFEKNRGKLQWPVNKGIVIEAFGEHAHPVLKQVKVRNNGIDIATTPGSKAKAVFDGTVSRVIAIPGGNIAIIIRHGNYLSVYSNLINVTVKPGDYVIAQQNIGTVFTDKTDNNKTVVKFQVWKENKKLNPQSWIK